MNLRTIWVIASTEIRTCRRLVRTGVFIGVALLLCAAMYILDIVSFASNSWPWPDPPAGWIHGSMAPQYAINDTVFGFLVIFLVGIVFICFDIHARDVQNRISEVVASKPASNLEITVGRIAGILLLLLTPILLFLVAVMCYETIAHTLGMSSSLGILSVTAAWSKTFDVLLFLLFFGSFVMCTASLIRSRLLVAIVSLGLLFGLIALSNQSFFHSDDTVIYSDLAPVLYTATGLVNRIALFLFSMGFLTIASAFFVRIQPRRGLFYLGGSVCLVAGVVCVCTGLLAIERPKTLRNEWITAHNAQPVEAFPDIQHLHGKIDIWPGDSIVFDLTLTVRPAASNSTNSVVFSLNPGYNIQNVFVDGEEFLDYSFGNGILKVSTSVLNNYEHKLRIKAKGKPNQHFAYLDQARNLPATRSYWIPLLGTKSYIFHPKFVALMPSIKWYPTSGSAVHEDLLERRPRDVFKTDLTVSVPKNWSVAMVSG